MIRILKLEIVIIMLNSKLRKKNKNVLMNKI